MLIALPLIRRRALGILVVAGLAAPLLAACEEEAPRPLPVVQKEHCRVVAGKLGQRSERHEVGRVHAWEIDGTRNVSVYLNTWDEAGDSRRTVVKCRYPATPAQGEGWGTPKIKARAILVNGQELSAAQTALLNAAISRY